MLVNVTSAPCAQDEAVPDLGAAVVTAAERARQRELLSYLTAASITPETFRFDTTSTADRVPVNSLDPILTGLVQLGPLRLGCDRSFLSLIDGHTQYIVAEATQTTSIAPGPSDGLYLGAMMMDSSWGVCPNTMNVFTDETGVLASDDGNITANKTKYVIRNFLVDDHFRNKPYVTEFPHMRCYYEVPITSPMGYVIGGYCVVDNKLRDFDSRTFSVLNEVASTIMAHLEGARRQVNHSRSDRLIRGLDAFMQEETKIRLSRRSSTDTASVLQSITQDGHSSKDEEIERRSVSITSSVSVAAHKPATSGSPSLPINDAPIPSLRSPRPIKTTPGLDDNQEMRRAFQRSADLIRDAMRMDGMVFLDACPIGFSSRDASISRYDIGSPTKSAACFPEGSTSTEYVPVLASSMAGGDVSVPHHITEGLLYRIICRFKEGHVFSADEYGVFEKRFNLRQSDLATKTPFDESDSASDPDAGEFLQHFPAARSIIFLPMWHFQKEKWFAAAIGWTCDSTQCFELGDATYLNAFANSIMAEVLRLEALAVSKAKSDFISSISHELRSPLHGILATTELLRESITSPEDRSLLEMVSSSGSTLLDTMDHLLEHAKINGLAVGRAGRSIKDRRRKRSDREATSALLLCNLAELVEGVVQDAVMGYSRHSVTQGSLSSIIPGAAMPASEQEPPPIVTINIQTGANWNMTLEVGAWKRIILNLVGNALKYTPSGSIEISLTMSERSGDNEVLLAVRDTGIGMSDDYQKYHLFSPFRQENPLSVGTGLGLSIVQQIVDMQGGKIGVKSQQGVGTLVTVAVPVPRTTFPSDVPTSTPMRDIKRLKGLRIGILRHSGRYAVDEESYEQQHTLLHHHKILGVSIASIAHDWFGVDTNIIASLDDHNFDILLLDQALDPLEHVALQTQPLSSKAIVVVRDSQAHKQHPQQIGTTLMLPVGPRRLAQVLLDALDLSQARAESSKQQVALPDVFASIPSDVNDRDILRDLPVPEVQARLSSPALLPTPPESTTPVDTSNGLPKPDVEQSPTQDMDASLSKLSTADQAHSQSSSPYVLIVDDNSVNVRILTTLVSRLNCPHLTASNGLEALQLYTAMYNSQKPFDMVLMDINMPVMDGYASTREIRAFEASQGVSKPSQIIALTGLGNSDSEREAARSGMDLFLTKPVKLDKLRALLGGEMHK